MNVEKTKRKHQAWMQKLQRTLFSGGVEAELFAQIKGKFEPRNRRSMFILAMLGIVEGVILIAGNLTSGGAAPALPLYIALFVISIVIAVFSLSAFAQDFPAGIPNEICEVEQDDHTYSIFSLKDEDGFVGYYLKVTLGEAPFPPGVTGALGSLVSLALLYPLVRGRKD